MGVDTRKSGLEIAMEQTLVIAEHLPNKDDPKLYTKTIHSIFDDQLKAHTTFNRAQRHQLRGKLNQQLKKRLKHV